MKKNLMKLLLCMAFSFLFFVVGKQSVRADVIYWPNDEFVKEHETECEIQDSMLELSTGRNYKVKAEIVEAYTRPGAEKLDQTFAKNDVVMIYYLYHDRENNVIWGCVWENKWIPMEGMELIYDNAEFRKDHAGEIRDYQKELKGYELKLPITLHLYPGSDTIRSNITEELNPTVTLKSWLTPKEVYVDEEGKVWGYVSSYNWGYWRGWYCISDLPKSVVMDYTGDGKITLEDALAVLKAALNINRTALRVPENFQHDFILDDALKMLKVALGIERED